MTGKTQTLLIEYTFKKIMPERNKIGQNVYSAMQNWDHWYYTVFIYSEQYMTEKSKLSDR